MGAALPTFSDEAIVRDRLALMEASASFLAALAQIPQSRISLALSGNRSLSREDGAKLKALTARLIELRDACGIVPLALHDAKAVRSLLDRMDQKEIGTEQVRLAFQTLFGNE